MIRRYKISKRILIISFLILMAFLSIPKIVHADSNASPEADNDITWNESAGTYSSMQLINIGGNLDLGYTFGLAQDTNGNVFQPNSSDGLVRTNNDDTVTKDSVIAGANNIYNTKMNIFLRNNQSYVGSVFQGTHTSSVASDRTEQVSLTSPDFLIVPTTMPSNVTAKDYSLLSNMTNKKIYTGEDKNGHLALKIVGDFVRGTGSGNNVFNLTAEIVLRASPTNSADIQRELYLKNNSDQTQSFQVLFGEDTKLSNNDQVQIKDLGTKNGLYIEDGSYKLMVTNQMPDGFNQYAGQAFTSGSMNWAKGFSSDGSGAESKDYNYGDSITGTGRIDSSYTLKWNPTTLKQGESSHYGSTMGVTANPYALPVVSKSYTNETTGEAGGTGKNSVNDKLKFSLKVKNNGYGSTWTYKKLEDKIPNGLQIDPDSLAIKYNDGTTQKLSSENYDDSTKTLSIPPALSLTDGQQATITYEATITKAAGGKTITNTADFTGHDTKTDDKTYSASVDIDVEKPSYDFDFTKEVKNVTNGETDFKDSTDAKIGDTVEYHIYFGVKSDSTDSLAAGSKLNESLPTGIEQDGSAKVKGPDGYEYNSSSIGTGISVVKPGENLTIDFKAKVTSAAVGQLHNTVTITGGTTTPGNETIPTMVSSDAIVNVQKSNAFTSVPSLIDFGSVNMTGASKTITNVATKGELVVTHPDSSNFNISVAYDNNNAATQMQNSNGSTLPSSSDGLLFIKQRDNSEDDLGTWQPLLPTGTMIRTSDFSGSQQALNLTNYVGANDWQMRLSPDTNAGTYSGTLTWSLSESI
ncbi:isopeptide-forming domain-containing fimbrial protein [Companilactobacillus alimentarius]|uniref:isopeptide-forming domain-containing fimbrial protein n=1 Tax=Companilactobacillus alimentarius TaxID=1602 RepID=UPI0028B3D426|nr:isopeptide-forming domain-containing fimbrial protein [Companilactobacillus alimentarius]MDT6952598.1 isopeptide-forming domain-containing fimbrial protein [Companilactobacillus alimentarius]